MIQLESMSFAELLGDPLSIMKMMIQGRLIICFLFDPSTRVSSQDVTTDFVINEDEYREGNSREPPPEFEGVHSEGFRHSGSVREEASKSSFKKETEIEDMIVHSLVDERITTGFANN